MDEDPGLGSVGSIEWWFPRLDVNVWKNFGAYDLGRVEWREGGYHCTKQWLYSYLTEFNVITGPLFHSL